MRQHEMKCPHCKKTLSYLRPDGNKAFRIKHLIASKSVVKGICRSCGKPVDLPLKIITSSAKLIKKN